MSRSGLNVSMQEVAAEAGVSRGALYRHFAGREALVEAVIEQKLADVLAQAAGVVDTEGTLVAQVSAAIRVLPATRAEPLATVLSDNPDQRATWMAQRWHAFWLPRLVAAQQRGEVRADVQPEEAVDWITRVQLSFLLLEEPGELDQYVDTYLLRGLGA